MKNFEIETQFVFTGFFKVKADTEEEAREHVENHCGLAIGSNIHSTLPFDIVDWDFPVHPDKNILSIKQV